MIALLFFLFLLTSVTSLDSSLFTTTLDNDIKDQTKLFTMGPIYLSELFQDLSFTFPAKKEARRPYFIEELVVYSDNHDMSPSICRMTNYLTQCNHSFTQLHDRGASKGDDNHGPYFVDLALTDEPVDETLYDEFQDLQYFPALATCVVPVHSVAGFTTKDPLVLDRKVLARIFRGDIKDWNHPDIIASNSKHVQHLNDAGEIKLVMHEEYSYLTKIFKESLSKFDDAFEAQIGISGSSIWNGIPETRMLFREGNIGVISYIQLNPNSIAYTDLYEADKFNMMKISLLAIGSNSTIECSETSVAFAVSDKGFDFGNDGSNPIRFTADIDASVHKYAWPISTYLYFALRLETNRPGANCAIKKDVSHFLNWFYSNTEAHSLILRYHFAPLSESIRNFIVDQLNTRYKCDDKIVYDQYEDKQIVPFYGIKLLDDVIDVLCLTYQNQHPNIIIEIKTDYSTFNEDIENVLIQNDGTDKEFIALVKKSDVTRIDKILNGKNLQLYPYTAIVYGIIFNLCGAHHRKDCLLNEIDLKLDINTISKIFDGTINYWNDTKIIEQNPDLELLLPHQKIIVVRANSDEHISHFIDLIKEVNPSFLYKGATISTDTIKYAQNYVYENAYTITVTPLFDGIEKLAKLVYLKNKHGSYVVASGIATESCAKDTFNASNMMFSLKDSMQSDCYPLSDEVYIVTPNRYSKCSANIKATVTFLQWLIDGNGNIVHEHDLIHHPPKNDTILVDTHVNVELALENNNLASLFFVEVYGKEYRDDGKTFKMQIIEQLELIKCENEQMLMKHANLGLIEFGWIYTMFACVGICISIIFGLGVWMIINRKKRLIRNSSPIFMFEILFGATLSLLSIFPMGMQDDTFNFHDPFYNKDWKHLDRACQAVPFLYSVGFSISFSALFVKTWRMVKLFNNRKFKRLKITDWMLLKYQVFIVGSIILFNVIWLIIDPLVWKRFAIVTSETGEVVISTGLCVMKGNVYYGVGPMMGIMIFLLLCGNYLSYKGRFISSEYAESKWVGFSMVLYLEALILGVPIIILSSGNASVSFFVKGVAIILADFGTVLLIFIPKIWLLYGWNVDRQSSLNKENSSEKSDSKIVKKGAINSKTNSKENNISTNPPTLLSSKSIADIRMAGTTSASLSNMGEMANSSGKIGIKMVGTQIPVQHTVKSITKSTDKEISVEIGNKIYSTLNEALQNENVRQILIEFAAPYFFDEPIRFYSDVTDFQTTKNSDIKVKKAIGIIKKYLIHQSPLELHLSASLKSKYENILIEYENEMKIKSQIPNNGWFKSVYISSKPSTVPVPVTLSSLSTMQSVNNLMVASLDGSNIKKSTKEEMIKHNFFLIVQKSILAEMYIDRKKWKKAIRFFDDKYDGNINNEQAVGDGEKTSQMSLT